MANNIKYRQLKAFVILVETGSFSITAQHMAITQPSLSVLIQELERDTCVRLIDRSSRRAEPTREGRAFYERIKGSMDHLDEAYTYVKDIGKGRRGRLRVACLSSLAAGLVTETLRRFHERHAEVRITLCERTHDQVPEAVRNGEVDLGIGAELRADPDLSFQPVFKDRLMVVVPAGHALARRRVTWKSLDAFKLAMVTPGPASRALKATNSTVAPAFEVEHAATALSMVRRKMAITVLPSSIVGGLDTGDLVCRPLAGALAVRSLGVIQKRNAVPNAAARDFIRLIAELTGPSWLAEKIGDD